jgi:2-succinyl-6-hydroxy-2,4-cyclohexadiene-1-carboxylate synthase
MNGASRTITVDDGVRLATVAEGPEDAPGLLLVHGFGGAKEDFADHLDLFAADHRVVVFDHRGHGASDAPDDPSTYSLDRLAADTLAVADAYGLRDLRLLGHSMGGMVTRRLVIADPARARALVFMDTSPGKPPGIDPELVAFGVAIVQSEGMAALRAAQDELDVLGSPAYERVLRERPGFKDYADSKWASLSPVMWSTLAVEVATQPDQLDALAAAVRVPTLVLVGDQDTEFLPGSRATADAIPGARLVVIPDAGHSPQFENPTAWYATMREFLDALHDL